MMLLTLPGTPTTYQGEEIGQQDIWVSYEDTQDPWGIFFGKVNIILWTGTFGPGEGMFNGHLEVEHFVSFHYVICD